MLLSNYSRIALLKLLIALQNDHNQEVSGVIDLVDSLPNGVEMLLTMLAFFLSSIETEVATDSDGSDPGRVGVESICVGFLL